MSMEAPMDKFEEVSNLINLGFSSSQVALAISEKNTFEFNDLMDFLTTEKTGKFGQIEVQY